MPRLNKNAKQKLVKIMAGVTAVCISPLLASAVTRGTPQVSMLIMQYVEENVSLSNNSLSKNSALLEMNSSALLLYKPVYGDDGESGVVTEILPPIENIENETVYPENASDEEYINKEPSSENNDANTDNEAPPIGVNTLINEEDDNTAAVMSRNISGTREDLSGYDSEDGHIVNTTFEPNQGTAFINLDGAGQVRNETKLDNEIVLEASRKQPDIILELNSEPEILIMHTHTSEAYQLEESGYFDSSYTCRSLDSEKNIVAVGATIAKSLAEEGITVIHDGTIHDSPEYSGSYARSAETVKKILAEYPSVKVVLDIHRDAIEEDDGSMVAAVTNTDGKNAAQVMIISAADDGTYDLPEYMENFKLAALLQRQMESDYPGITRPVLFQYCHYNQQLTTGSLLIEVGSHGNSLEQAKYSGELIGKSIAKALLSLKNS